MLIDYQADDVLPDALRELWRVQEEIISASISLRLAVRAEAPPGHGVVSLSTMFILTPVP